MSEINYNKFKESLARLQERYNDYLAAQTEQSFYRQIKNLFKSHAFSVLKYVSIQAGSILKNI